MEGREPWPAVGFRSYSLMALKHQTTVGGAPGWMSQMPWRPNRHGPLAKVNPSGPFEYVNEKRVRTCKGLRHRATRL
ncbi:hypothetical protein M407DRAFT_103021 [Tulasnella calospora MUT 4182]|uniref:Uncharacterized protein n=1 Tax=Tulasnella calospora MUT 4182 TaxID=1051891 RepID=A0A0C3Q570_9AGAM|nr:hypothetical protein M407DRAFT_103021 [Tulasnella calospora MUT 4182]